jgi:hypothetical protein
MDYMLFWLAVFGNLVLAFFAIRIGLLSFGCFARNEISYGFDKLALSAFLFALTAIFPESLISGDRESGKIGLIVCLLTPFVVMVLKLMPMRMFAGEESSALSGRVAQQHPQMVMGPTNNSGLFPSDDLSNPSNTLWPGKHS